MRHERPKIGSKAFLVGRPHTELWTVAAYLPGGYIGIRRPGGHVPGGWVYATAPLDDLNLGSSVRPKQGGAS